MLVVMVFLLGFALGFLFGSKYAQLPPPPHNRDSAGYKRGSSED